MKTHSSFCRQNPAFYSYWRTLSSVARCSVLVWPVIRMSSKYITTPGMPPSKPYITCWKVPGAKTMPKGKRLYPMCVNDCILVWLFIQNYLLVSLAQVQLDVPPVSSAKTSSIHGIGSFEARLKISFKSLQILRDFPSLFTTSTIGQPNLQTVHGLNDAFPLLTHQLLFRLIPWGIGCSVSFAKARLGSCFRNDLNFVPIRSTQARSKQVMVTTQNAVLSMISTALIDFQSRRILANQSHPNRLGPSPSTTYHQG